MGVSLYPVLEREVLGFDVTAVSGKALAHAVYHSSFPELTALGEFFSVSPEEVAEVAGYYLPGDEDADEEDGGLERAPAPPDFQPPPEEWFEPAAGLSAVRAALRALRGAPTDVQAAFNAGQERIVWVVQDLEAVEQVLLLAQEQETRFHFAMDF